LAASSDYLLSSALLLQLFCPLEVPIGHECQLRPLLAIRACPRQGETSLRLRAIVCAHRHKVHLNRDFALSRANNA
jgi:hypothetical protein